nr:exonuclease SbcCD subunit D [Lachnospiraceae bacterium]
MKFLHISDLHIGKQLYGYSLLEDQWYVLGQVLDIMEKECPDAILIAGDIYDKAIPGAEAVRLFDRFLTKASEIRPKTAVFVIAGNHDSARRIDFAGDILCREQIYIVGTPPENSEQNISKVTLTDAYGEVDVYILPFFKPGNLRGLFTEEENESYVNLSKESGRSEYDIYFEKLLAREKIDFNKRNIMLTHQFYLPGSGTIERTDSEIVTVGTIDNISAEQLSAFEYVAMGHIHRPQNCGSERMRYCGTLMPYSLSEEKDEKSVTMITLNEKGTAPEIEMIPVKPLRGVRKIKGTKQEIISAAEREKEKADDYVSITVTDEQPGRFVREELGSYFSHILEIRFENSHIKELIGEGSDAPLCEDYFEMFGRFYEMRNGITMSEQEKQILAHLLGETEEEEE